MSSKTILITGASGAIGKAIALELAETNNHLILTWNTNKDGIEDIAKLVEKRGASTELFQLSLEDEEQVSKFCNEVIKTASPDILINNAAIAQKKDFLELSTIDWDNILAANLRAPFQLSQSVIPEMQRKGWGRIVNISSVGGQWGGIHQVHYAASKAGLINLTRSLAKLYSKDKIATTAIAPGIIDTSTTKMMLTPQHLGINTESTQTEDELLAQIPCGRLGTSEEIAKTVKYLCSEQAEYLSGVTLNINGGIYFSS
tara:strand:- start:1516 stop:2289 length:774 start_codon:yes stop_codon:yes gene_type:complete